MKKSAPPSVVYLDQQRRIRRAATFIARGMSASALEPLAGELERGTWTRHLPEVGVDLSVCRGGGPSAVNMLSWARRRATNLVVVQIRDPREGVADAAVHVAAGERLLSDLDELGLSLAAAHLTMSLDMVVIEDRRRSSTQ